MLCERELTPLSSYGGPSCFLQERTPLGNLIRWRDKPVALSIVQARLVGLAHFSVGYIFTYAAFLIASTSGKFG